MKPHLTILSILFFCSLISACGPKHLGPELTKDGVSFTFYAPEARSVTIAGTFNAWDTHRNRLSRPDNNGVWRIIIPLSEGRYEYLFIVDGKKWHTDPYVPEVDDGFGGKNSILLIGNENSRL